MGQRFSTLPPNGIGPNLVLPLNLDNGLYSVTSSKHIPILYTPQKLKKQVMNSSSHCIPKDVKEFLLPYIPVNTRASHFLCPYFEFKQLNLSSNPLSFC